MNKNIIQLSLCNNCGKTGHSFYQCKLPITSYGVVCFQKINNEINYLMIRRKDSFGYIDFIRGKYSPYNIYQIQNIVNEMTNDEKHRILTIPFDDLWINLWGGSSLNAQYKNENQISYKKLEQIKNGIIINNKITTLRDIVNNSPTTWTETEWEFPKGRREINERDLDCALREFEEETGISKLKLKVVENILPFEETFIGTNYKCYKHKYFLAYMKDCDEPLTNFQTSEVSKMEWKTIEKCMETIRTYNLEKKEIIKNINNVLLEYRLYL